MVMTFQDPEANSAFAEVRQVDEVRFDEAVAAAGPALKSNAEVAKAEALGKGHDFTFDGKSYHLDPAEEWDIEVMEYFAANELLPAVKLLVGDEQYAAFKTDENGNKKKRTMKDLGDFLQTAMAQLGVASAE